MRWRYVVVVDEVIEVQAASERGMLQRGEASPSQIAPTTPARILVNHTVAGSHKGRRENHRLKGNSGDRIKQDIIAQAVERCYENGSEQGLPEDMRDNIMMIGGWNSNSFFNEVQAACQ